MVYVPQGSFYAGSGGTEYNAFYKYPTTTNPYQITGEGAITVGTATNNLYYPDVWNGGDQLGPIPSAFPKGYNAFCCMKYEISQQGYVDLLNSLTQTQANTRKYTSTSFRYAITGGTAGSYATTNPHVACNYLSWADVAAYLDWSGLRPMTELEFEKSCRGTLPAVPNEYAWGNTLIASSIYTLSNSGANNENIATNYSTSLGNAAYSLTNSSFNVPMRVGIFAGNVLNSGRVTSGATYYGIMEMSGNLWGTYYNCWRPHR
jgi:formylglycine-generating enzyme required for sulfatase activity